jgi:hypothetical protein
MTKDLLRQMIREMVKEEVRAAIPEVLSEIFAKPEQQVINTAPKIKTTSTPVQPVVQPKKEYKKYTSNELLNKALNETVGGLPKEGGMVTTELAAPSVMDNVEQAPPVVAQALTKNYSALMKAIDKKKSGGLSSGSVSMM